MLFKKGFLTQFSSGKFLFGAVFVILLAELIFLVPTLFLSFSSSGFMASVLPAVLIDYANDSRSLQKVSPLEMNPLLTKAAQLKANDMALKGYFSHIGPHGERPWVWLDRVGYDYTYAGENLAMNFNDSKDINRAWLNSPAHRENILKENFREIGIGVAEGNYNGHPTLFVVQFFGNRSDWSEKSNTKVVGTSTATIVDGRLLTGSTILTGRWLPEKFNFEFLRLVSSPRHLNNLVFGFLILAVFIFSGGYLFGYFKKRRSLAISLAVIFLLGLLGLLWFNNLVFFQNGKIASHFVGAKENGIEKI